MFTSVHLAVYDTLSDWEVGFVTAHINKRDWQRAPGRYRVVTVGPTSEPITTMGGLRITPDLTLDQLNPTESSMLILAGSETWGPTNSGDNAAFLETAGQFLEAGVPVAAICGATLGLASAGMLDDREHTSNAIQFLQFAPAYQGSENYRDEPAVADRGLITASGTAPVAFARAIFDALDLYSPAVLRAWFDLYGTGDPNAFFRLEQAAS
jgi:putative intracellular protease/amidase